MDRRIPIPRGAGGLSSWSAGRGGSRWEHQGQAPRTGGSARANPYPVRVLHKEELGRSVHEPDLRLCAGLDYRAEPPTRVLDVEPEMVKLRARTERFVERCTGRVVVQLDAVVGAREDEVDPFPPVRKPTLLDNPESEGSVEPNRSHEVPYPDARVHEPDGIRHGVEIRCGPYTPSSARPPRDRFGSTGRPERYPPPRAPSDRPRGAGRWRAASPLYNPRNG
jgi:hypothetical protein